jgi:hypothetical protein
MYERLAWVRELRWGLKKEDVSVEVTDGTSTAARFLVESTNAAQTGPLPF